MKRRILRILGIGSAVLAFTGYFAFSTFVFSPFEGDYEFELATLVPRDVDVFVSKGDLGADIGTFPEPRFLERLAETERGARFLASPEWTEAGVAIQLENARAEVDRLLGSVPIPVDPLEMAGGRELAFASYASAPTVEASDWALYLRTNWVGKLGLAALDYPDMLGLSAQGLDVEPFDQCLRLSGGQLTRPLFVTRLRDVLLVSSAERLVTAAFELEARQGQDSLGQSASYYDNVARVVRDGDELRLAIDYSDAAQTFGWPLREPQLSSPIVWQRFLAQLMQPAMVREVTGLFGFRGGLSAELVGEIDSDQLSPLQKRFYRKRDGDQRRMADEVARFVPEDSGLFAYVEADMGDLIRTFFSSSEPDLRSNFESEILRPVFEYATLDEFVAEFEAIFSDRIAVILRPNDFPVDPNGPQTNDRPTFAWGLVLWADEPARVDEWRDRIVRNAVRLGIRGRTPDQGGVFRRNITGGLEVFEYFAPLVPGTGHVASVQDDDYLIVSNHALMLQAMINSSSSLEGARSVAERAEFQAFAAAGLPSATATVWFDPEGLAPTLLSMAEDEAQFTAMNGIDWETTRAQIEQRVLREQFPGEVWGAVSESVQLEFDAAVEREIVDFREQRQAEIVPELVGRAQRRLDALQILSCGLLQLRLEQKDFELTARLSIPLED